MNLLKKHIIRHILNFGPMPLDQYMELCLLHPQYGFYNQDSPIGANGSFITAPEISQMFGELIGLCIAQTWIDQGKPTPFTLLELGPGRGTLMADFLRSTWNVEGFNSCANLVLHEASHTLRNEQQHKLRSHNPYWIDTIVMLPELPTYAIANEFFDSLPIKQYQRIEQGWIERGVGVRNDELVFGHLNHFGYQTLSPRFNDRKVGEIAEIRPQAMQYIDAISNRIQNYGGSLIIIDYGEKALKGNTLQAVSNNKPAHPLNNPGITDLTAHVDFGALQTTDCAISFTEISTQGQFLHRLGLAQRSDVLSVNLHGNSLMQHLAATKRLVSPDEMGTLFKVMAIHPQNTSSIPGFQP